MTQSCLSILTLFILTYSYCLFILTNKEISVFKTKLTIKCAFNAVDNIGSEETIAEVDLKASSNFEILIFISQCNHTGTDK